MGRIPCFIQVLMVLRVATTGSSRTESHGLVSTIDKVLIKGKILKIMNKYLDFRETISLTVKHQVHSTDNLVNKIK